MKRPVEERYTDLRSGNGHGAAAEDAGMTDQEGHDERQADGPPAPHRRLSHLALALLAGLILFLLVATLVLFQEHPPTAFSTSTEKDAVPATAVVPAVQVLKPQRRDVTRSLSLPANISPWYRATLYAKVSGYLKWIGFDKGDEVKKGQLLAVIEAPEVLDDLEQAEADYAIKKLTYERLQSVWKENPDVIAKQDVDMAAAAAEGAKQQMEHRRTMLTYTKITAPFAGTITARFADPGTLIQSAIGSATQANPLFTLMDLDTVRVYVSVPQESAYLAKPGVPALLSTKEAPGQDITGTVTRTTESLDPATRTLLVEIDLPNKDHRLQPGMFVNATLLLERHPNALTVPPTAIEPAANGRPKSVFVVDNGKARRVPIKTGIDDGSSVEVVDGLTGSEDVVVVGRSNLADGQPVTASPYTLPEGKPAQQKY